MLEKKTKSRQSKPAKRNYADFTSTAYRTAYSITRKRDDAKDVAQLVTMRYLIKENQVEPDTARNWIVTTSKNESYLFLKNQKREILKEPEQLDTYESCEQEITDSLLKNKPTKEEYLLLLKKIKQNLPEREQEVLLKYFAEGEKLCNLVSNGFRQGFNKNKTVLYQKIYRLRKDARAQYMVSKGMKCSKEIVSYNLNQNIIRFLCKYRKCIRERSFKSMKRYFKEIGLPEQAPKFDIREVIDYDVILTGRNKYKIHVHFINNRGQIDYFSTDFTYDERKTFSIKKVPHNQDMEVCVTASYDDLDQDFLDHLDRKDREGFVNMNEDEIREVLDTAGDSQISKYPIKNKRQFKFAD